jgi:tetratricopeptide (TPR) repeat protein
MSQFQFARIGLLLAAIGLNIAPSLVGAGSIAHAASQDQGATVRPEVGKPLQAAQELLKTKKYKDALTKVQEADGVGGKTPYESFMVERTRASIASAAGDTALAAKSFEAIIASGRLSASDQIKFIQALAGMYYQLKDYPKAIAWFSRYVRDGGDDPKIRAMLIQTYYLNNEFSRAAKELQAEIHAEEKAGNKPSEDQLQLLANCAAKQSDKAGYAAAIEKLVAYYPKKEYWADLLNRVQTKPGFADRLSLDVFRLKMAVGQLTTTADYMEMSQLALQAGFPAEAQKIVEQGFKTEALGTGADAARHKRLRDLANKTAADDLKTMAQNEAEAGKSNEGIGLVNLGFAYVSAGQFDKGIGLMEQGIRKGGIKRIDDAKLHMAIAYLRAGQKPNAIQMFKTVQGVDGTADLAHYWVMQVNHPTN